MEWFNQKKSIGGIQVSNWGIVLGAIIIALAYLPALPPLIRWRVRRLSWRGTGRV